MSKKVPLALILGSILGAGSDFRSSPSEKNVLKAIFTEEELAQVRACKTKKERKQLVEELRKKYSKE